MSDLTGFEIPGVLRFAESLGGLKKAVVSTPLASAEVYLQGAHITQWAPSGQKPVLFMSQKSLFAPGKAIRGGVPIIFPWFGARSDGKTGPAHGFARTMLWTFESAVVRADGALEMSLGLTVEDFGVRFRAAFGKQLEMSLEVQNQSGAAQRYEEALHTYLAVGDIRQVSVSGLEETTYIDKTDNFLRKAQGREPVRIAKETDSVYVDTQAACSVDDPVWQRRITVEKSGSASTVVWNPWVEKTAGMADMGADDWQRMICVESANASENAIVLPAGGTHTLTAVIRVE